MISEFPSILTTNAEDKGGQSGVRPIDIYNDSSSETLAKYENSRYFSDDLGKIERKSGSPRS
jgi:hypothetical protein